MERLLVTVEELAALAGVDKRTVWRDVKRGRCPRPLSHVRFKAARWSLAAVRPWIARRRGEQPGNPPPIMSPAEWWAQPLPELVTVEELTQLVPLSERTIWRLVAAGEFIGPLDKPERPRLWRTADVRAWLKAKQEEQAEADNG